MDMDMELDALTPEQVRRLQLLYLFPRHYEFHRDEVIQLWMAHDLVPLLPPEDMELQLWFARESGLVPPSADIEFSARFYFEEFEEVGVFQMSTLDYSVGQQRYKLSNSFVDLLAQNRSDEFFRVGDLNSHVSENTKHASFRDDDIDPLTLHELYKAERLLTLLILHRLGSHLAQIPRDLFLKLPLLRVLDLSYSSLTELPSSIGILKDLRYLNLSYTPITALPKSLCSLYKMQTLKLKGCLKLVGLPKGMRKLINLRHLEVDLDCLMVSMPPGLGDLAELRTLPAFVVGKEDGCHITELKNMINLCGTLSILRLENVSSSGEAKISALDNKKCLQNLELHWTDCVDGFQVLDNLLPHTRIKELQIVGYGGAEFPNWIGKPIFFNLATITISDCRNSELFPPLGNLPSLQYLSISDMHAVKQINSTFCGRNMTASLPGFPTLTPTHFRSDDMLRAFESLEKLTLNGMPMLETWNGIEAGDFPNLQKLSISQCPKLTSLPELSLLVYLQHLEISLCPLLDSFPSKGLPRLLRRLVIIDCPLLGVLSHKDDQKYWEKLAHISSIWIDYEQIIQRASGSIVAEIPISELISASMAEEKEETLDSGVNENKNEKENESVKLFVGQVPKHMTEAELLSMFKEVALVDEVNVIKDKATRASRGCCFVICPSRQEADKAVTACHNKRTLPGASSPLQVKYADGELERLEHKLFVGMLPKNVSDADVSDLFSKYGTVKDLQILRCSQQTSKGCAFLKYETKEQALAALEAINGKYKMEGSSVPLVVKWADTEKERQARRAQKAQSQAPSASTTDSGQQPSLFGAFPMGYMPPYNGFGYQAPGTYGLMQYPLPPMQNQPGFPNLIPPVNRANALRGISPDLRPGVAHKNFIPVPSAGFIGSAYPSAPGLQYPIPYPGRIMSPRPMTSSHVLSPPAIANSSPGTSPTAMTSSGAQVEGPPGANLFIYHIPQEFGDQELANAFQPFGRVLSAKVFVDKATGVSKCFGFVSYDSPAAAQSAINMMNGCQLGGKKLKVQLKRDNKQNKPY